MFQFLRGRGVTQAHIRAVVVVSPEPFCGVILNLLDCCKHVLIQPFMPDRSVVTFDIGVLLRLSGLDMLQGDTSVFGPLRQAAADIFRAIIDPDRVWFPSPPDNPVERSNDAGQSKDLLSSSMV